MPSDLEFPVLDFNTSKVNFAAFAKEVFEASKTWGFFILENHGIDDVDRMFHLASDFFSLDSACKAQNPMNKQAVGYDGDKLTSFAASEGISFGTPAGGILASDNLPEYWDQPRRIEIEKFKASCKQLSDAVMSCYAIELGLDQHYFARCHEEVAPGNTLKMIKYPRFTEKPSDIPRLSEHTDWGSITFVFTSQPGLEVRDPNNTWYDVPLVDNAVIVNIGDALSLWTGKQLKSTMHRISWANLDINQDRYSIAYFTNPNLDAVLSMPDPLAHPDDAIRYRDYYNIRLGLTYGSITKGRENFDPLDPIMLRRVKELNVANSGILGSHAISTACMLSDYRRYTGRSSS